MGQALKLHADSRCTAVTRIEVDIARPRAGNLVVGFLVIGRMRDLHIPPATAPTRTDDLWRHTCFEAFIGAPPSAAYYELNFAPSRQWAVYRFSDYRRGMRIESEMNARRIDVRSTSGCCGLQARVELNRFSSLRSEAVWRLGLSAVIEEKCGRKSYWALAHPPGKADFHHPDCFACELPIAERQ